MIAGARENNYMLPISQNQPLSTDDIHEVFQNIRDTKQSFKDIFENGHHMAGENDTTKPDADGYHKPLIMKEFSYTDPITEITTDEPEVIEDGQMLFVKKINGLHELCAIDKDEKKWQITEKGRLSIGSTFEIINLNIPDGSIKDYIYFKGLYIIADYVYILTSTDFSTWTQRYSGSLEFTVFCTDGNILIAAGQNGTIVTSTDGITWTVRSSGTSSTIRSMVYLNGLFIASHSGNGYIKSTDGITWSAGSSTLDGLVTKFGTFKNMFIAVSYVVQSDAYYNYIYTSPDGVTWTLRYTWADTSKSKAFISTASSPDLCIAMLGNTNIYVTSPDGITWTSRTGILGTTISYACNMFYNTVGVLYSSPDGITWTPIGSYDCIGKMRRVNNYLVCGNYRGIAVTISKFKELS